jgi:quercetin dioxygenase-like cupin family protein
MPFFFAAELAPERTAPDAERTIKARGGAMMASEMRFAAGAVAALHEHPHEQIIYILEGELDFTCGGETRRVRAGDSLYAPPGVVHGAVSVTASRVLDVFTPQREDFLKK